MDTILIIEDDQPLARGLIEALKEEPYLVKSAATGERGLSLAIEEKPDLIILDLVLPDKNGLQVCKELRLKGIATPILMLTSKKKELDKVLGLESGADDYVTKPFGIRELQARIKILLRRQNPGQTEIVECRLGEVYVNFKKMEAHRGSVPLKLTALEFNVLKCLALHKGEAVSRDVLLNEVWGYEHYPTTRAVDTCILNLRKKIETQPSDPQHIVTVHAAGYRLVVP